MSLRSRPFKNSISVRVTNRAEISMPAATTNLIRLQTTQGGRSDPIDSYSKASYD